MNDVMDVDSILDAELDDLEDLPEFKPFPCGAHRCLVTMEMKEVNKKQCVEMALRAIETLELDNSTDEPLQPNDETNVLFMLDNKFGVGKFKEAAAAFADVVGSRNNRAIIEGVTEIECIVVTTQRVNKESGAVYTNPKEIQVV